MPREKSSVSSPYFLSLVLHPFHLSVSEVGKRWTIPFTPSNTRCFLFYQVFSNGIGVQNCGKSMKIWKEVISASCVSHSFHVHYFHYFAKPKAYDPSNVGRCTCSTHTAATAAQRSSTVYKQQRAFRVHYVSLRGSYSDMSRAYAPTNSWRESSKRVRKMKVW